MKVRRVMVPVLLCFNVHHDDDATKAQISEQAQALIVRNLGDIGEEADKVEFIFEDATGRDLDAALYPSDFDWCDTMAHTQPEVRA